MKVYDKEFAAFDAVLFDLDDTLHDRTAAFRLWAESYIATQLQVSDEQTKAETLAWLISLDEGGYGSKPDMFARIKNRFPDMFESTATVTTLVEEFHPALVQHIHLANGATLLLDALAERGIPFGIITNGSTRGQTRKIARLQLDKRISCLYISEAFGVKKPDSAIFLSAVEQLGVKPERTLFIGDHPRNDIWGAQQIGMQTAWLANGNAWPTDVPLLAHTAPTFALNSLKELLPLLNW